MATHALFRKDTSRYSICSYDEPIDEVSIVKYKSEFSDEIVAEASVSQREFCEALDVIIGKYAEPKIEE